MPPIGYITRCYVCGCRLTTVDDYGKLDSDDHWYDPDWVIARHISKTHKV